MVVKDNTLVNYNSSLFSFFFYGNWDHREKKMCLLIIMCKGQFGTDTLMHLAYYN